MTHKGHVLNCFLRQFNEHVLMSNPTIIGVIPKPEEGVVTDPYL